VPARPYIDPVAMPLMMNGKIVFTSSVPLDVNVPALPGGENAVPHDFILRLGPNDF